MYQDHQRGRARTGEEQLRLQQRRQQQQRQQQDQHPQQQQVPHQPQSQYSPAMNVNVEQWQDPSMYYAGAGHPSGYAEESGLAPSFPMGAEYPQDLSWMESYAGQSGDVNEASGASAPVNVPRPPILRTQTDTSRERELSVGSADAGQPGSSAAAASAEGTRRSTPSGRYSSRPRLEEENRLLIELRDRQRLPWREVTRQFEQTYGREFRMPTLQMRYGRLRQSSRDARPKQWTDADTEALQRAWQWYMEERWRIIAEQMQRFGASEQWSPEECEYAWQQLTSGNRVVFGGAGGSGPSTGGGS